MKGKAKKPNDVRLAPARRTVLLQPRAATDLLRQLGDHGTEASCYERCNAALGCKTSEVAFELLRQVVGVEEPDAATASDERMNELLVRASAMLAELEPRTATESLLAAQMIGTQRLAMTFLARADLSGQTFEGVNANIQRATRLMRVFNEQAELMAKLKGKSGQQRVVVEHVTVRDGGQAIVGVVSSGGRGENGAS